MGVAGILLFFYLAIISTDLGTKGGLPALADAHPSTNSGYGIMGTTDEEDSEKWAKEQEKAFKKLEKDWHRRRISSGVEGSGSGSDSVKTYKHFTTKSMRQFGSKEFKPGHKRQMAYGMQQYAQVDTSGIINQAVAETIQENTTDPPPMPPTMPKTTSPVEPDTNLPNLTPPPPNVSGATVNKISETNTVQGTGSSSSSVNVKGGGGQTVSIKTSQKGQDGDNSNISYNTTGPKPGEPVALYLGNNTSNIDVVDSNINEGQSVSKYYSGSQMSEQTGEVQPTAVTPIIPVNQNINNITTGYSYSYNVQSQRGAVDQNGQPEVTSSASNNNHLEEYATYLPNTTSSNMNPMTEGGNVPGANNVTVSYHPPLLTETTSNYYLGGVNIQNSSYTNGQQENLPTRSTLSWANVTQPIVQSTGQNMNPSVAPTQRTNLTSGIQNSIPVGLQMTQNRQPSFSIKFQTEVANPTRSTSQQAESLNIRPIQIGRLVSQSKDGGLVISSSSTYEIGRDLFNANSPYQSNSASNTGGTIQNGIQEQSSEAQVISNNPIISLPNKPNSERTNGFPKQKYQPAKPTLFATLSNNVSPTPSWLPTYSLLKSMRPKMQPDQVTAEASINITEILIPKGDSQRVPVMVMQSPSKENSPTVKPLPIQLIDEGNPQEKVNELNQRPTQAQTLGPTQSQTQSPTEGLTSTSSASTSMFSFASNPTVVGTVNPTTGIITSTSKMTNTDNGTSLSMGRENGVGNITNPALNIEETGNISLTGNQDDDLTVEEMENMMHLEDKDEKMLDNKNSSHLPKNDENGKKEDENKEDTLSQTPSQALISQAQTADPYGGVKDALLSVDIAQLRPGELLSLRLPNSQTSDIFKVKDIKSNDDVSAYSSDLDIDSENVNQNGLRDKKHILYAIIEKVKSNKNYRNAMRALFSTADRRSWKNLKSTNKSGKLLNRNSKVIDLPEIAILRSYSKDDLDKKNERKFVKLFHENIGLGNVVGLHSSKKMKNPDIVFDNKKGDDANKLRTKLLHMGTKMHRLHRKTNIRDSKRSGIHSHSHYHKKPSHDEKGSKKTKGTFQVTLKVSGKKEDSKNKGEEESEEGKSKEEKTEHNDASEPEFEPGKKLKFEGTFTDEEKEDKKEAESKVKQISSLQTKQILQGLKANGKPGNVIIEDEKGNVLYKGPVNIAALNKTIAKKGGNDTGFQLQNVGYRVDPSANTDEIRILKQGLQQVMPNKRGGQYKHRHQRHHPIFMHKTHSRRRYSRSVETSKDVDAVKKTDGTFKLTFKVSGKEQNKEGKDDVNMNDSSHHLFNDGKELTFQGKFTDDKDSKDERKENQKQETDEEKEKEEEEKKKKKGKENGEEVEEEAEEEEEKKKKNNKKKKKEDKKYEENEEGEEGEKEVTNKKEEQKKTDKEEEAPEESEENRNGENKEKTSKTKVSNENNQDINKNIPPKKNATNVIIEDSKGNMLYKGLVDISALNKTVSSKNGTYSGFHLETAGYKVEESVDPQEVELINDGLKYTTHPNSEGSPLRLFKHKRRRRSIIKDQSSLNAALSFPNQNEPTGQNEGMGSQNDGSKQGVISKDIKATKKTDGTFKLTFKVSDKPQDVRNEEEKNQKGKDDVIVNSSSQHMFNDEKELTFQGTFSDDKDPKDAKMKENKKQETEEKKKRKKKKKKKKKEKENEEEEEEETEETEEEDGKKKKGDKEDEEGEAEEEEEKKKKGDKENEEEEAKEEEGKKKKGDKENKEEEEEEKEEEEKKKGDKENKEEVEEGKEEGKKKKGENEVEEAEEEEGKKKKGDKENKEEEEKEKKKGKKKKGDTEIEEEEAEKEEGKKKKGDKDNKEEEKEEEKEEKETKEEPRNKKKKGDKENNQSINEKVSSKRKNTNVIIEDGKGNVLYKGLVDIAALNKTLSTKKGTYTGFHLESAGYKIEESVDPQEMELINDGLKYTTYPNNGGSPLQQLEPKRRRRSIINDQPSKETDKTFTLTLALNDDKTKNGKEDTEESENKRVKYRYSDFQQNEAISTKGTKKFNKIRSKIENDTISPEESTKEDEALKTVSPHVIIEDEHGKPLYQGPVDIIALNKSVASKGGSINYELRKEGYQLVKDSNKNEPTVDNEGMGNQPNGLQREGLEKSNHKSPHSAGKVDQIKQHMEENDPSVIKISNNGDSLGYQKEQKVSVGITNEDKIQDHSTFIGGKEQQSTESLKTTLKDMSFDSPRNNQLLKHDTKILSNAFLTVSNNGAQKLGKSKSNDLPKFDKEDLLQHSTMQDPMDDKQNNKITGTDKMVTKSKSQGENALDNDSAALTANSFIDTSNSKLLHMDTSNAHPSWNRTLSESPKHEQNLSEKVSSGETLRDESNNGSKGPLENIVTILKDHEHNGIENNYNVLLTKTQNGGSSIGGKILETSDVVDKSNALDKSNGTDNETYIENTIPNDNNVKEADSNTFSNEIVPNQKGQNNPKNMAFLNENVHAAVQLKTSEPQMLSSEHNIINNVKNLPKKYQVLRLTRHKLKELLESSAKADNEQQQQLPNAAAMQDNPKVSNKNENKAPIVGMEQPITLILSGPYLDQLAENKNETLRPPTINWSNKQMKNENQTSANKSNIKQNNMNDINAMLDSEGKNITSMLPSEMLSTDDDKIWIGAGGKTVRPAPAAEGAFKSQETASGLNLLLKTPDTENPGLLVPIKNASPSKISSNQAQRIEALPTVSVLSGSGQRVDCHALPEGSSLTLLRCGSNGQPIAGPTVSSLSKAQTASMLGLTVNDIPQNPIPQHQLTEPDVAQNIMGAPDFQLNDEPQLSHHRNTAKPEYGYGTVTDPSLYRKMSSDIKDYLDKEIDDEKNMIQGLLVGSSAPRASLPSQNNHGTEDDSLPFGFAYIPGADENNLYNLETQNQGMYQGFPNEYLNTLSNQGMERRPHRMIRSRSKHRNNRRSKITKAYSRPGPWRRRKSSRKRVRAFPVRHWNLRRIFTPPLPLFIRPLCPQPWLLTKRCCNDGKNNDEENSKSSESSTTTSVNQKLPSPENMSEWEYLGRVLCSCPCFIECVNGW